MRQFVCECLNCGLKKTRQFKEEPYPEYGEVFVAHCKVCDICSQTYYKWQKRLFSVGKTAIVNVDPPPSPLQRKQGRPEILLTGPHLFPRIFFPASAV